MVCRRIYQRKPWTYHQSGRWVHSSSVSSFAVPAAATRSRRAGIYGSLSRVQAHYFDTPGTCTFLKCHYQGEFFRFPLGIRGCFSSVQAMVDLPAAGVVDVPLAQTGEGIAECELLKWFVKEGEHVEEFQPLCEVQSDKATIEITSRYKGKVSKVLHVPGNIVKVGETLLKMVLDESICHYQSFEATENMNATESNLRELKSTDPILEKEKIGGVLSTPVVRNFAKQVKVTIEDVCGTGKDGRILKEDVLNYAIRKGLFVESSRSMVDSSTVQYLEDQKSPVVSSAHDVEYEDLTIPLKGFQRAMAKSMTFAAKVPHFHYVEDVKCDTLIKLKASFQSENSDSGVKFTFLPLLIKSLSMALSRYPLMNSCFNEELQELILKGSHNIGVAMATPNGLVVPNIKKVQSLSILEITKELSLLQELALANKLCADDISGGTITISNIGAIGGKFGSPLINVPEVSIIALGRIHRIPHFDEDGSVCPMSVMTISIGADHRVLDGATVARFCNEWKHFIEKPEILMLHMR